MVQDQATYNLARFTGRAEAFLFARDPRTDDLVYLEDGTAAERRADVKANLVCPEPKCSSPELTTVSRAPRRRDGYRHLRRPEDTAHAPESMMHRQAKALVARWAESHPDVATVEVEKHLGERIADVLLTLLTGARLAVEVQYSPLSREEWVARTESYLAMGIQPVWLWGHIGHHAPQEFGMRDVPHEVAQRDWPLIWLNPMDEVVAWAHDGEGLLVDPIVGRTELAFCRLDDLMPSDDGLLPDRWLERVEKTCERRAAAAAREAQREADRQRLADLRAARRSRVADRTAALKRDTPRVPRVSWPDSRGRVPCVTCGLPVDPILAKYRRHLGC